MDEISAPAVSVILPTHNRAALLKRSIKSILDQTCKDFELIVIDDASTDDTEDVIRNFGDKRIRYIKQQVNMGAAAARNAGITASKGKYIAFQDDDDEWLPAKLSKQVEVFENNRNPDLGVVYSTYWKVDDEKRTETRPNKIMPEDGIVFEEALYDKLRGIGIQTVLTRRGIFDEVGMFDEAFPRWIDHEFFIRASRKFLFYRIDEPLVNCYETPGGISSSKKNQTIARKMILDKYADDFARLKNKKLLAEYYYDVGHALCLEGKTDEGRRYVLKAISTDPWHMNARIALLVSHLGQKWYYRVHPL